MRATIAAVPERQVARSHAIQTRKDLHFLQCVVRQATLAQLQRGQIARQPQAHAGDIPSGRHLDV